MSALRAKGCFGHRSMGYKHRRRHQRIAAAAISALMVTVSAGCAEEPGGITGVGAGLAFDLEYVPKGPDANVFSAKYICGETAVDHPLVRAIYRSEISIINPDDANSHEVSWRVAFVYPATPPATNPVEAIIGPFRGIEINCEDILAQLGQAEHDPSHAIPADAPLLKGFVVVSSDTDRIRVSGAYTALHKQIHGNKIVDLVPKAPCEQSDDGLVVSVLNQGDGDAPKTTTELAFTGSPPVSLETPALGPGVEAALNPVPLPDPSDPAVAFKVTADANASVEESDETNNQLVVTCEFGP